MNKFVKILIDKSNIKFKSEFQRQKNFFKKPDVLAALGVSALFLLDNLLKDKKSKKEIKDFIQNDKNSKIILNHTSKEYNEDNLNELILACFSGNETLIPEIPEDIDFISLIDKTNDIDEKINLDKLNKLNIKFVNTSEMLLTFTFLLYYVIDMSRDLFKTEFPSKYRTKHIQKLLRNLYGLLKLEQNSRKTNLQEIQKLLDALKKIDNVLIAITLATTIYIINRVKLQKKSKETLREIAADVACSDTPEPFDVSVNRIPFKITLNCPVNLDDVLVPHVPIELKLNNFSCEVTQNAENIQDANESPDLATYAVIRNHRKETLTPLVTKDSYLTTELQIANLGGKVLYSPVNGFIDELSPNQIVLRDISDPIENYLTKQINLLNEKYQRLNEVKSFLKDYYIASLYPVMLSTAIAGDSSINLIPLIPIPLLGIDIPYNQNKKNYSKIKDDYEKQIKKITGKDNVEMHAKNETLNIIKEDIEKEDEKLNKSIKLLGETSINLVKKLKAKPNEYELFEFYSLDLCAEFNGIEKPNKLEIEYRDAINEFIRKRYIIDGYSKLKLGYKIHDLIKEIEKGISVGNWFDKAMDIYKSSKKLTDVKTWLTGLANKNKKIEQNDKIILVNRIMFLVELYLNIDAIVKKYTILKKDTTSKKEVVKEANYINKFFLDLWKEMDKIPKEIEEIQKMIDSLSMFQTYSIIDWKGYQARLYSFSEEPKCQSKETDPYLNAKSQYGYGDIQYWLKYCAFATLASVTNPVTGWSTGWITPTPISFPVIYIPIKSIITKYGFIVIGLSICGIYLFPWSLFVNLSTGYTTPFGDPTAMLKNEVDALKKAISEQLKNLRRDFVKRLMDETKEKIDKVEIELKDTKKLLTDHKGVKPTRYPKINKFDIEKGIEQNLNYVDELTLWVQIESGLKEKILTLNIKKWELTKIHKILYEAYKVGKSVGGAGKAIEQSEKLITKQLDKLSTLIDKIDKILAPLPITLIPESANFGITLKNTKPVIKIADELNDNVNEAPLNKIFEKFELKNKDLMTSNYGAKLSGTAVNSQAYKTALSLGMVAIIKRDAFPKYELLKPTNVAWLSFLYKDFVPTGAKTYGFPGQSPPPI